MRKSIVQAMSDSAWMMKTSVEHGNICRNIARKEGSYEKNTFRRICSDIGWKP